MTQVLQSMQQAAAASHGRHVFFFQQTSAQHFGSNDGGYDTRQTFMGSSCKAKAADDLSSGSVSPNCDPVSLASALSIGNHSADLCTLPCAQQQNSRFWSEKQCICKTELLGCHEINSPNQYLQNWRNDIISDILRTGRGQVHLIPFFTFTVGRGKMHVKLRPGELLGMPDCTHYCYSPLFWEPLWSAYLTAFQSNSKPAK